MSIYNYSLTNLYFIPLIKNGKFLNVYKFGVNSNLCRDFDTYLSLNKS